jgi:hypothetical protein
MKMGGAPILWTWVSILFFRWFGEDEMEETAAASPSARSVEQIPER